MLKQFVMTAISAAAFLAGGCAWTPQSELSDDFTVFRMYGDHMVLQRNMPISVSGTAKPGYKVIVSFDGTEKAAEADFNGIWRAEFPARREGGPYELSVRARDGAPEVLFTDILVGEVWLCAGQSNMEMPVFSTNPFPRIKNAESELSAAAHPLLRLYNASALDRVSPRDELLDSGGPGWLVCTPESVKDFSACGYFFGRDLQEALGGKIPLGLVNLSRRASRIEAWCSQDVLAEAGRGDLLRDIHSVKNPSDSSVSSPLPPGELEAYRKSIDFPSTLFNARLFPWLAYPFRGVIWYQGRGNAGQADYWNLNRLMIRDWRRKTLRSDMPFLLVQLSGFLIDRPENPLPEDAWKNLPPEDLPGLALTREHQAEMTKLPNVGMAVSMDVGEPSNAHPGDKQTVGHRLALLAERMVYGMDVPAEGPVYDSMRVENGGIRLFFWNAEGGLETSDGNPPGAFTVAGADGKFVRADARIDGESVFVSSPLVKDPVTVRYAWAQYRGDLNLRNRANLPAVPFRTDKPDYKVR